MNKVMLMGRLTRDVDVKYDKNNNCVALFSIAVPRTYDRETADFFNCVAFGKTAEFICDYYFKGKKVIIIGELQNDTYEDDGITHYNQQILVRETEFAESKKAESGEDEGEKKPRKNSKDEDKPAINTGRRRR